MCKLRVTKPGQLPSIHSLMVWWNALTVPLRLNSQNLLRITNKTGISRNLSQGCYSCDIHCNSYNLNNNLLPFLEAEYPDGHQYMQDNDPKHTSWYAQWWYEINWWKTPASSPDLDTVEHIWHTLREFLCNEYKPPKLSELKQGIKSILGIANS